MILKRKICVVTGTRAEYGLLRPLLKMVIADNDLELQLIVTGTHLSKDHGYTLNEIERDGFKPSAKIEIVSQSDGRVGTSNSVALAISECAIQFDLLKPDIVVVLGDRFEILGAAVAASVMGVPLAHIAGGELTEGAFDDGFRHAITKLANVHFATTKVYADRVLQMGESESNVWNVGSLGMDNVRTIEMLSLSDLELDLKVKLDRPFFVITFHPVTLDSRSSLDQFRELLSALRSFPGHKFIFTKPNADPEGRALISELEMFSLKNANQVHIFDSLGVKRYFSLMKASCGVLGNSSSGIAEAPALSVPTVNIGKRQQGRVMAPSIVNCESDQTEIVAAIRKILDPNFLKNFHSAANPYGDGHTASRILSVLKVCDLNVIRQKHFVDRVLK